jgi:Fe-S-cluster-containing hydrogenase component 2
MGTPPNAADKTSDSPDGDIVEKGGIAQQIRTTYATSQSARKLYTCIGCSTCATNCPYDSIRMVEVRSTQGQFLVDDEQQPILKATKCDLCVEQTGGPACQNACPHNALSRTDLTNVTSLTKWLIRK